MAGRVRVTVVEYLPGKGPGGVPLSGLPMGAALLRPVRISIAGGHTRRLSLGEARHLRDQLNAALFLAETAKGEGEPCPTPTPTC